MHASPRPATCSQRLLFTHCQLLGAFLSGLGPTSACVCLPLPSQACSMHLHLPCLLPAEKAIRSCSLYLRSNKLRRGPRSLPRCEPQVLEGALQANLGWMLERCQPECLPDGGRLAMQQLLRAGRFGLYECYVQAGNMAFRGAHEGAADAGVCPIHLQSKVCCVSASKADHKAYVMRCCLCQAALYAVLLRCLGS